MPLSRIVVLAKEIESNTTILDDFFTKNNLPPPSFEEDAPLMYQFPPNIAAAQEALSAALDELTWLNKGPTSTIVANSVRILLNTLFQIHLLITIAFNLSRSQDYSQI
jgi:hypothetical protein